MNDNEIRRLINASAENPETGEAKVSAEEVKNLVMAKIGSENKNHAKAEDENEVYVEPTFVTVSGKRKPNLKIAAVSAAACLGIACVGGYFALRENGGILSGGTGDETGFGGENGSNVVLTDAASQSDVLEFTLLDGYKTTHDYTNNHTVSDHSTVVDVLELRNGQLWFVGNGENINVAEAAGDKSYYIYTYYNTGTQSEHKVVVSNTNEPWECGYFELYCTDKEEGRCQAVGRNCFVQDEPELPPQGGLPDGYKQWVYDAAEDLGFIAYDNKIAEEIKKGETVDMSKVVYITGSAVPIFAEDMYLTVHLLDGYVYNFNLATLWDSQEGNEQDNLKEILELRNGELYFIGNGENINVAEAAGDKSYYTYTYINSDTESEHRIFISNTNVPKDYGYFELFKVDGFKQWRARGRNCFVMLSPAYTDDYRPWVHDVFNDLGLTVSSLKSVENDDGSSELNKDVFFSGYALPVYSPVESTEQTIHLMMDGEKINYFTGDFAKIYTQNNDAEYSICYHKNIDQILEIKDGCLWVKSKGMEDMNITELADGREYYIYTGSCEDREHTFVVRNTTNPEECGYFEVFDLGGYFGRQAIGRNTMIDYNPSTADSGKGYKTWVRNALNELGLEITLTYSEDDTVNGKAVYINSFELPYVVPVTASNSPDNGLVPGSKESYDAIRSEAKAPEPEGVILDEKFKLLDGSIVKLTHTEENIKTHYTNFYPLRENELFANENGRIYFIGNGEHIDITDSIGRDEAYVYTYTHPERNSVHYLIAGGYADTFGYAEIFSRDDGMKQWWGCEGCDYMLDETNIDDFDSLSTQELVLKFYRPWLASALIDLDIYPYIRSEGTEDFAYLFDFVPSKWFDAE